MIEIDKAIFTSTLLHVNEVTLNPSPAKLGFKMFKKSRMGLFAQNANLRSRKNKEGLFFFWYYVTCVILV